MLKNANIPLMKIKLQPANVCISNVPCRHFFQTAFITKQKTVTVDHFLNLQKYRSCTKSIYYMCKDACL